ncbi:MAG: hypothetical protein KH273_05910, partial [Lacticaseibacillus paracasei]|uniref:hypothetical protein n=1 Tax=Lacticaseibacillus paracasei TaxID=1597 RepID=UPI00195D25F3
IFAHAITTDAWRNSLDHYQEFVIIVALDLKIEAFCLTFFIANLLQVDSGFAEMTITVTI